MPIAMSTLEDLRRAAALKQAALARLHEELGYQSPQALASAILEAAGRSPAGSRGPRSPDGASRRTGRRLSAEVRQSIINALKSGVTGTEVTRQFGISYPTVHEIKKSLGMVQARPGTGPKRKKRK